MRIKQNCFACFMAYCVCFACSSTCLKHLLRRALSDIDDCVTALCLNGATCIDGMASYTCRCTPGKTGVACEIGTVWFVFSGTLQFIYCIIKATCTYVHDRHKRHQHHVCLEVDAFESTVLRHMRTFTYMCACMTHA